MKEKKEDKPNTIKKTDNNIGNFVGLIAVMLGIYVAIVFGFLIFSGGNAWMLVNIAWAFTVLGAIVAFFMYKTAKC